MNKIIVIIVTALLTALLPNAVFGQVPAVRGALRSASKVSRVKPVKIPRIAVPHVPNIGQKGYRLVGPLPPPPVPTVNIPAAVGKVLALADTAGRAPLRHNTEPINLSGPVNNIQSRQALAEYADSAADYSDETVGLLLDSYIYNTCIRIYDCYDYYSDPKMAAVAECFSLCRHPRLAPYVENDFRRVSALAVMAAKIAAEDDFCHYRDIGLSLCPEAYEGLRTELLGMLYDEFGTTFDKGPDADRARFRMVAGTSDDPANDLGNMITKAYAEILSNIWGFSHMPYMKYIKECPRCTRRMEAVVATIDDLANYVADTEYAYDDQLWGERTAHYLRYILDPSQSSHITAVEDILGQINESDIESKYDMILETAVILADMKGRTDANPALAIETLKPYEKLADSDKADPIYRKYYYEYLLLLYDITGDIKNRDKAAQKLEKINKALA